MRRNPVIPIDPGLIKLLSAKAAEVIEAKSVGRVAREDYILFPGSALPYWDDISRRMPPGAKRVFGRNPFFLVPVEPECPKDAGPALGAYNPAPWMMTPLPGRWSDVRPIGVEAPEAFRHALREGATTLVLAGAICFEPQQGNQPWMYYTTADHEMAHLVQHLHTALLGGDITHPHPGSRIVGSMSKKAAKALRGVSEGGTTSLEFQPSLNTIARNMSKVVGNLSAARYLTKGRLIPPAEGVALASRLTEIGADRLPPAARKEAKRGVARGVKRYLPRTERSVQNKIRRGERKANRSAASEDLVFEALLLVVNSYVLLRFVMVGRKPPASKEESNKFARQVAEDTREVLWRAVLEG